MARREWVSAEDQVLHRWAQRESASLIAQRLKRSPESVRQRMRRLGLTAGFVGQCRGGKRYWTKAEKVRAIALAERLETGEIGRLLGRTATAVGRMLWREVGGGGVSLRDRRTYYTPAESARMLRVVPGTIYRFAWRLWPERRGGKRLKLKARDIAEMAGWMLAGAPPRTQNNLRVSANHLRRVIDTMRGDEDVWVRPDEPQEVPCRS